MDASQTAQIFHLNVLVVTVGSHTWSHMDTATRESSPADNYTKTRPAERREGESVEISVLCQREELKKTVNLHHHHHHHLKPKQRQLVIMDPQGLYNMKGSGACLELARLCITVD